MTPPKKSRETGGEGNRDGLAYTYILRNELLGANIEGVKGQCDERRAVSSPERKNLFQVIKYEWFYKYNFEHLPFLV